jgi:polysaccharide deacetylase 2 family uncharacterized protein YibQ
MRKSLVAPLAFLAFILVVFGIYFLVERPGSPPAKRPEKKPGLTPEVAKPNQPSEPSDAKAPPAAAAPRSSSPAAKAAVIMDDLGNNLGAVRALIDLGQPVTLAILPYAPVTSETVRAAREAGLEYILHLPLESLETKEASGGRISGDMTSEEVRGLVESCLDQVPGCRGANNHEGSKVTENPRLMTLIFEVLKARGLYFIDSLTTSGSVAYETARRSGVRAAARRIFLDEKTDESAIRARFEELFAAARKRGAAVAICHPKKETFAALAKYLSLAERAGVRLVFASEIVD